MRELGAIGETFAKFGGQKLANEAIEKGWSTEALRSHIMNAMTAAQTTPAAQLGMSPKETQRFSIFKAIRALTDKNWKGAEFELECHNEVLKRTGLPEAVNGGFYLPMDIQNRDLTVASATGGGNLVGTNLLPANFIADGHPCPLPHISIQEPRYPHRASGRNDAKPLLGDSLQLVRFRID